MLPSKRDLWRRFGFVWAASFGIIFAALAHHAIVLSGLDLNTPVRAQGLAASLVVLVAAGAIAVVSCLAALVVSDAIQRVGIWLYRRVSGQAPRRGP